MPPKQLEVLLAALEGSLPAAAAAARVQDLLALVDRRKCLLCGGWQLEMCASHAPLIH